MDSPSLLDSFISAFKVLGVLFSYWWLFLPPVLVVVAWEVFQLERRAKYLAALKWVLLSIRIPKDPHRSPKATEQIFSGLHGTYQPVKPIDRIFKGKVPDWFSFEIVSLEGRIGFFVRTLEQYRNLVESQIYAHYPDVEISEVRDYVHALPLVLPNKEQELWGAEMALTKEDAYPIRTYEEFEEKATAKEDIKRVDTMAMLSELLSTLHTGEHIWIQYLVRPAGDDWVKRAQEIMDKLSGKLPKPAPRGLVGGLVDSVDRLLPGAPTPEVKEDKKPEVSPGKGEVIRAIEKSINKLGHETGIRFIYIGPRDNFHRAHIAGLVGVFKQFSTQNLNGFKLEKTSVTSAKWPFKMEKERRKKVKIYKKYRNRLFTAKPFVLNTEELATVYHFPDVAVKSPLLPRVEAKKGEPPTNLPVMNLPVQDEQQ